MNKLFFKYKIWYLLVSFFVFIPACKKESVKEVLTGDTGLSSDLGTRKYSRPDGAGMDFCGKQFRIKMNDDTVMHMYGDFASDGSPKSIRSIYYEVPNSESKPLMLFNENGKVEFILFYTETDSLLSEYFRFEYFSDKIVHSIFQANWETEESAMKFEKNLNFDANGVITGGNTIQPYTEIPSGSYQNHTRLNELKNGLISSYNYSGLHADQLNHLTNVNQNVNN